MGSPTGATAKNAKNAKNEHGFGLSPIPAAINAAIPAALRVTPGVPPG